MALVRGVFVCISLLFSLGFAQIATALPPDQTSALEFASHVAPSVSPANENDIEPLLEKALYFVDRKGTVDDPDQIPPREWKETRAFVRAGLNQSFMSGSVWVLFRVQNQSKHPLRTILNLGNSDLQFVDLIVQRRSGERSVVLTGHGRPASKRPLRTHTLAFPLDLDSEETVTGFLRVRGVSPIRISPTLQTEGGFFRAQYSFTLQLGLYLGVVFAMVAYNFVLFLMEKHRLYLDYVLSTVILYGLVVPRLTGFIPYVVLPETPMFHHYMQQLALGVGAFFAFRFAQRFMHWNELFPRWKTVLDLAPWLQLGIVFVLSLAFEKLVASSSVTVILIGIDFLLAINLAFRGVRSARIYLTAWTPFLLAGVAGLLTALGFIAESSTVLSILLLSCALETCLMALGLADRINTLQSEISEARKLLTERLKLVVTASQQMSSTLDRVQVVQIAEDFLERGIGLGMKAHVEMFETAGNQLLQETVPVAAADLAVPLTWNERTFGRFCLKGVNSVGLPEQDLEYVRNLAASVASAFENIDKADQLSFQARLESTLATAHVVQEALLLDSGTIPGIWHKTYYRSADQTGGDWQGCFWNEKRGIVFFISADVTGHGVPSAIVTGVLTGSISFGVKGARDQAGDPALTLQSLAQTVNEVVFETGRRADRLATMAIAALELATGKVWVLNAGHTPVFQIHAGKTSVLSRPGTRLGFQQTGHFPVVTTQMKPGDSLFFHTDGLTENQGADGRTISHRMICKTLTTSPVEGAFDSIRAQYESLLNSFREKKKGLSDFDDCAFILAEWRPWEVSSQVASP